MACQLIVRFCVVKTKDCLLVRRARERIIVAYKLDFFVFVSLPLSALDIYVVVLTKMKKHFRL